MVNTKNYFSDKDSSNSTERVAYTASAPGGYNKRKGA
jgi:hypothetical protein